MHTLGVYVGQEIQQELNDPTRSVGPSHAQNMLGLFVCLFVLLFLFWGRGGCCLGTTKSLNTNALCYMITKAIASMKADANFAKIHKELQHKSQ